MPQELAGKRATFLLTFSNWLANATGTEMQSNRHTVNMTLHLNDSICSRLKGDPNQRIMVYCYAASGIAPYTPLDISFPNQIEVKVNGDDVKSNFKGLKNKPGTTKPADITSLVRKAAGYPNNVQITYALTTKVRDPSENLEETALSPRQKYTVIINMVQKTSADALADRVKQGRYISKAQVLNESESYRPCQLLQIINESQWRPKRVTLTL